VTVACVQQRLRLHDSIATYREDLRRFLRAAQNKNAQLVIFPEVAGVLVAPPLLRDFRSTLLKRADWGRRKQASLWQRFSGLCAHQLAVWLHADLRQSLQALLALQAPELWALYANLFSELAREFAVVLVAPSAYLPEPGDLAIRNLTAVFGPDGALLGQQAKVILHPEDEGLAQAGEHWTPIHTPVGALGLMLGGDVLYPEVGRLLAYQGAEALIMLGAATTPALYQKLRSGMLARMQDNQLYGVASFVIGQNELGLSREPFAGKSAIFAPQELTPRFNGVLVEMGSSRSEGVLTAEWDYAALRQLWEVSDTPVRRQLPLAQGGQVLAKLYERLKSLPPSRETTLLAQLADDAVVAALDPLPAADDLLHLEDLPVIGVVTRRWSGIRSAQPPVEAPLDLSELPEELAATTSSTPTTEAERLALTFHGEDDETDEMDALPENAPERPR
jgi:predicted amidohydrolase